MACRRPGLVRRFVVRGVELDAQSLPNGRLAEGVPEGGRVGSEVECKTERGIVCCAKSCSNGSGGHVSCGAFQLVFFLMIGSYICIVLGTLNTPPIHTDYSALACSQFKGRCSSKTVNTASLRPSRDIYSGCRSCVTGLGRHEWLSRDATLPATT